MPRLSDQERQEVMRYLAADQPLSEKNHFLLFEDKRQVELVWNGMSSQGPRTDAPLLMSFRDFRTV